MNMALESFENWTAPWEAKGEEFDAERAKKYVYDVLRDRDEARDQAASATKERDALQAKVSSVDPKDQAEVETLRKEVETMKAESEKTLAAERLEKSRLELALEHDLTPAQARRLRGSTPDELAADVDALKTDLFGEQGRRREDDSAPQGRFRTGAEDGSKSPDEDPASLAKLF